MGFFGTFLIAIVTTPFIVLPILLLTAPSSGGSGGGVGEIRRSPCCHGGDTSAEIASVRSVGLNGKTSQTCPSRACSP